MRRLENQVQLIGNVGNDPEITVFKSGEKKAQFRLATNSHFTNTKGEKIQETHWHNIIVYGKIVEIVENYVPKGKKIGIEGKLTNRSYDAKDGTVHYVTEVICRELLLLGSR